FQRRPLKRKNRLLFIADREDRALERPTRADTGGELGYPLPDDLPLLFGGVLRLIDQQKIYPEVERVVRPCSVDAVEQAAGLVDQIVVVEEAVAILFGTVARNDFDRDGNQRRCAVTHRRTTSPGVQLDNAGAFLN